MYLTTKVRPAYCAVCDIYIYIYIVKFTPLCYIASTIDKPTAINHNKALLVLSVHATCFDQADHPQAFKYVISELKNKMYIYFKCVISRKLYKP